MNPVFHRRHFLRGALATAALFATSPRVLPQNNQLRFPRVKVARDRVIREIVGLRPYRPSGFLVSAERIGEKLLVHNYGHGGAGITLSWGTASMAVDLARDFVQSSSNRRPARFAVIGCGVIGLSTARLLQKQLAGSVTIYTKDLPPETTSNIAGGFWHPTSVYEESEATTVFMQQYERACVLSHRAFQLLVGNEYGVRWIETLELLRNEASVAQEMPGVAALYPQTQIHREPEQYFGFPIARHYYTMMIEPHVYLSALLRDFYIAGGKVVLKEFGGRGEASRIGNAIAGRRELMRLPESVIFNCTGLGARSLLGDRELTPVRGQLEILLPQPEIDYCYLSSGYMFPRRDGIVLGGTWDRDDWSLKPDPEQAEFILQTHADIMKAAR